MKAAIQVGGCLDRSRVQVVRARVHWCDLNIGHLLSDLSLHCMLMAYSCCAGLNGGGEAAT